jgi:hypothetical protein
MWTLMFGHHEDRMPAHGYTATLRLRWAAFARAGGGSDGPVHDEQIARWNQQRGPRVGDWCETKDGGLHRIGGVRGGRIRLASPSGRFSLGSEGVTYFGIAPMPVDVRRNIAPACRGGRSGGVRRSTQMRCIAAGRDHQRRRGARRSPELSPKSFHLTGFPARPWTAAGDAGGRVHDVWAELTWREII